MEFFRTVRAAWPAAKSLGIWINGNDWDDVGLKVENTTRFAKALAAEGYDFLDAFDDGIDYNSYANRHNLPANTKRLTSWLSTRTASYPATPTAP